MTVRATMWPLSAVITWSILGGLAIAGVIFLPGGDSSLGFLGAIWLFGWIRVRTIRLEITETAVTIKRGWFPLAAPRQMVRSQIRAIHYYPDMISFRGPDGYSLIRTKPDWALRQMIKVAAELQVPVYDNRRCLYLVRARVGKLVYSPGGISRSPDGSRGANPGSRQGNGRRTP